MAQVETELVFDDKAVKTGGEEAPIFGVSLVKKQNLTAIKR